MSVSSANRFNITAVEAAHQFVLRQSDPDRYQRLAKHIDKLWDSVHCTMMNCDYCNLGFAHPFVAGDAEFYNLAAHADYPADKWEYSRTVEALKLLGTSGKRGLEIGSGYGNFLKLISPRFFAPQHLLAIEYNEVARKRLVQAGFCVEADDIRSDAFVNYQSSFDFIFMFQVLEHMDNLETLTQRLHNLCSGTAHIFIAVPNPYRTAFNENHRSLIDAPPNHISQWTRKSFERFAANIGCVLADFEIEPMSWRNFIKQDLVYSHMQRAQKAGTFANWLRSKSRTTARRLAEGLLAFMWIPTRIPHWISAYKSGVPMGGSLWVHLRKSEA